MENFTPLAASLGGVLIGLSAVILFAFHGRIAGISGIVANTIFAPIPDKYWRLAFIIGLALGPILYSGVTGNTPNIDVTDNYALLVIAGLLVGFGTRLGSGCTSGHGVCGLPRLSKRSVISVALFMSIAVLTVALMNPLGGV